MSSPRPLVCLPFKMSLRLPPKNKAIKDRQGGVREKTKNKKDSNCALFERRERHALGRIVCVVCQSAVDASRRFCGSRVQGAGKESSVPRKAHNRIVWWS